MKCDFLPKCRNFTYKGLINKVLQVALDQGKHFELIYTLVEVFVIVIKNEIV